MLRDAFASLNIWVLFVFLGAVAYFLLYRISLFVIAQFALPVDKWVDRKKAYNRLILFSRGNMDLLFL